MNPIEVTGLSHSYSYDQDLILKGLNLSVPQGSVYGLLGRNGSGKTTLLRCIMGLLRIRSGKPLVLGSELHSQDGRAKQRVAYVAQGEFLPAWARIKDLTDLECALRPVWDRLGLDEWMTFERLTAESRVKELSVGQRKRLELELALAGKPKVMLLDEPLAGLDPVSRSEFIEQVLACAADGDTTILVSSHILGELERLCDRVGILAQGAIQYETTMDDVKESTALVTANGTVHPKELAPGAREIARRSHGSTNTWVLTGLSEPDIKRLEADSYSVSIGSLEDLGVELLRCLDQRAAS